MKRRGVGAVQPPGDLAARVDALEARVAQLEGVLSRVALAFGAVDDAPFSTRRGREPPEFEGRRKAWLKTAKTIHGAIETGRWTSVPRPAYAAWLAAQAKTSASAAAPSPAPANDAGERWSARAALASVGIRPTREGRA